MDRDVELVDGQRRFSGWERREVQVIEEPEAGHSSQFLGSRFSSVFDENELRGGREEDNDREYEACYRETQEEDEDLRVSLNQRRWSPQGCWAPFGNKLKESSNDGMSAYVFDPDRVLLPARLVTDAFQNYPSHTEWGTEHNPADFQTFLSSEQQDALEDIGPSAMSAQVFTPCADQSFVPGHPTPECVSPAVKRRRGRTRWDTVTDSNPVKMVVVPTQFPARKLSEKDGERVLKVLMQDMLWVRGRHKPKFTNSYFEAGIVFVTTADDDAASLLVNKVNSSQEEIGIGLVAAPASELLKMTRVSVCIDEPLHKEEPDQILQRLKAQNAGLKTEEWILFKRKKHPTGQTLFLQVDRVSLNVLIDQRLKAFLGLTKVTFEVLTKPPYGE